MSGGAIPKGYVRPKIVEEVYFSDPLDAKTVTVNQDGVERKVQALHKGWVEKRTFMRYVPPPFDENGMYPPGAQEMWLESMEYYEEDLRFLLRLQHHRFWSQVVYNEDVHKCLNSYLMQAQRSYDEDLLDSFSEPVVESIHNLVLLVFLRMSTHKESKEDYITPSVFGEILYDNFVFDICKILDICVLYGPQNQQLISKMIGNIFTNQKNYYSDLADTIPTFISALGNMEEQLGVAEKDGPLALSSLRGQMALSDVHNMSIFLNDMLSTLLAFFTCHSPARRYFCDVSFDVRLSACYERVIPAMMDILGEQEGDPREQLWMTSLLKRIDISRRLLLKMFRLLLDSKCFEPLKTSEKPNVLLIGECVEKFVQVISTCAGDKIFIVDYSSVYPLADDIEYFKQLDGDITGLDFIKDAVTTARNEMGLLSSLEHSNKDDSQSKEKTSPDESGMNGYVETGSAIPSDIELSSLVSHVQDLLPDLGEGFIQQCLMYYNYSTEAVINAVLEGSLPPSLVNLDRSAPAVKEPTPQIQALPSDTEEKSTLQRDFMDRANVYSNDEFDVFSRKEVDRSKIHKGKKSNKFLKEKLDENERGRLKQIARQYEESGGTSIYEDELKYEDETHRAWDYDDEYDDTYDDYDVGTIDVNPENLKRRPGIIGAGRLNAPLDESSDSTEGSDEEKLEVKPKPAEQINKDDGGAAQKSFYHRGGARPKNMGGTRGVQRIIQKAPSKPDKDKDKKSTPTPERENREEKPQPKPDQFCENPEAVRQRAEQRRLDREGYRHRGYHGRDTGSQENSYGNSGYTSKPRVSSSSNKNSGKGWRQGYSGDDGDRQRYHGGKYKEDSNHGKAQSQQHRHKMTHKNEYKRQGAQAKFNRNN
ncbi:Activating signal cointegrator 1 complex subunit 2 [Halocaridina rubra]|uniref:Activating signal cointegrator 1 complex subunit 2 n=1 Tax=Halocaridina rubra TaxID=373956 RepID=A0AAN8XCS7_HALRR